MSRWLQRARRESVAAWWRRHRYRATTGLLALTGIGILVIGPSVVALGLGLYLDDDPSHPTTDHAIGTEVHDGPVAFVVHTIRCGVTDRATHGQRCEVVISARNDGTDEITVPGPAQKLLAVAGARYLPETDDPEPFGDLAPGEAATTELSFDVPTDAEISHVQVHASAYTHGQPVALGGPPLPLAGPDD